MLRAPRRRRRTPQGAWAVSKLPPPPPEAEAEGEAKKPWRKPRLRMVSFSLKGTKTGNTAGVDESDPFYTPNIS